MADPAEIILEVPKELVENCNGFSMDFGGSVLKLVYRDKADWEELQKQDNSVKTAKLRMRSYSRPDFKEALELLKQHCYISRGSREEESPNIFTTGLGCYEYGDIIDNTLNVKTKLVAEFDCFKKSFHYLSGTLSRQQMEYEMSANDKLQLRALEEDMVKMMTAWKAMSDDKRTKLKMVDVQFPEENEDYPRNHPFMADFPDMYPCIAVVLGSGFGCMQISADGSFELADFSSQGGRTFLGLGSLLVGHTATYHELLELAVKGDNRNVDVFMKEYNQRDKQTSTIKESDGKEDVYIYAIMSRNQGQDTMGDLAFNFGKAATENAGGFKMEDIIRAHLNNMVGDLVQTMQQVLIRRNIKRCFVCGSFIKHSLVRELISKEWIRRKALLAVFGEAKVLDKEVYFVRIGAYLGALGALINHTDNFI